VAVDSSCLDVFRGEAIVMSEPFLRLKDDIGLFESSTSLSDIEHFIEAPSSTCKNADRIDERVVVSWSIIWIFPMDPSGFRILNIIGKDCWLADKERARKDTIFTNQSHNALLLLFEDIATDFMEEKK
jgi:hypothetical protein